MRTWFPIALFLLTATLSAQSGRTFRRESRLPVTPAASAVVDATAQRAVRVEPERRLRSGRAWSAHHFARRPSASAATAVVPVDAASRSPARRTPMWGRPVRAVATAR